MYVLQVIFHDDLISRSCHPNRWDPVYQKIESDLAEATKMGLYFQFEICFLHFLVFEGVYCFSSFSAILFAAALHILNTNEHFPLHCVPILIFFIYLLFYELHNASHLPNPHPLLKTDFLRIVFR